MSSQAQQQKIAFANTLRGFAALSVLFFHYFYVFWVLPKGVSSLINAPELRLPAPSFVKWIQFDPIFSWGPFGVGLFFLISGFVMPFSLRKATMAGFLGNRILRILPTYMVGFSLTLCALLISCLYFGQEWPHYIENIVPHYFPGIRDVLNVPTIDGIIWTLDIEMKFYLVCALCIAWFRRMSKAVFTLPFGLFLISIVAWSWLGKNAAWFDLTTVTYYYAAVSIIIASQFIVYMFIGTTFHYLHQELLSVRAAIIVILALLIIFITMQYIGPDSKGQNLVMNYVWALSLFSFAYAFPRFFSGNWITDFFANISYPLYEVHGICGYVALRIMLEMEIRSYIALPTATVGAIALAFCIHWAIERPFHELAKSVSRRSTAYINGLSVTPI